METHGILLKEASHYFTPDVIRLYSEHCIKDSIAQDDGRCEWSEARVTVLTMIVKSCESRLRDVLISYETLSLTPWGDKGLSEGHVTRIVVAGTF